MVTATTVGYGDITPTTTSGKVFTVLYVPVAVIALGAAIGDIAQVPMRARYRSLQNHVLEQFGDQLNEGDFIDLKTSINLLAGCANVAWPFECFAFCLTQ